jgi:hypothetical protein
VPAISDKSIDVLPFENRSTNKENAFPTVVIQEQQLSTFIAERFGDGIRQAGAARLLER